MRWKEKATVIFAFGTRTPYVANCAENQEEKETKSLTISFKCSRVVILIILRQTYLNRSLFHPDPSLHLSNTMIATAVLLHYSIMVSTVPCLKPFIIAFDTGWGQGVTNSNGKHPYFTPTGKSASTTHSRAYTMSRGEENEADLAATRLSQESQNSQQLIIHQTQEFIVEEYEMHSVTNRI